MRNHPREEPNIGSIVDSLGDVPGRTEGPSEQRLRQLVIDALPSSVRLTPLRGLKMDLSANPGFLKVYFSARCECGTAALLSVEVADDKTAEEIEQAGASLADKLASRARAFYAMSCETHTRMRGGPATTR